MAAVGEKCLWWNCRTSAMFDLLQRLKVTLAGAAPGIRIGLLPQTSHRLLGRIVLHGLQLLQTYRPCVLDLVLGQVRDVHHVGVDGQNGDQMFGQTCGRHHRMYRACVRRTVGSQAIQGLDELTIRIFSTAPLGHFTSQIGQPQTILGIKDATGRYRERKSDRLQPVHPLGDQGQSVIKLMVM